jgi:hypothetical protein
LIIVRQPSDEIKKVAMFFQSQAGGFYNNQKVRSSRFSQNGNIKSPTVASLVKNFLIANSNKYIQFLDKWIPVDSALDCPSALLL